MRFALVLVMVAATAAPAAPVLSGDALVWVDAPLYLDPDVDGPSLRFGELDDERQTHLGYVVPVHVVGAQGELVEIEPTPDAQCAWWRIARPAALASLHLFVRRADLAPVLTGRFATAYKDGSRIALEPGLAVDAAKGDHAVMFDADRVPVDVPDAIIGWTYAPHPITAVPPPPSNGAYLDSAGVQLGPHVFQLGDRVAARTERRGEHVLFPIAARCASATVSAPQAAVDPDTLRGTIGAGLPGAEGASRSTADRYYLPKGTKLTSATGSHVVATLAGAIELPGPVTDKLACTDLVVERAVEAGAPALADAPPARRTLHLCAPAAAVAVERRSHY